VVRLEPEAARVVVGPKSALAVAGARLSGSTGWARGRARDCGSRSARWPGPRRPPSTASVRFESPEYGVAPGQAAVIYEGERLLGGGWIEETLPASAATPRLLEPAS
jgi:tRNA-specific 2-thiouridylase